MRVDETQRLLHHQRRAVIDLFAGDALAPLAFVRDDVAQLDALFVLHEERRVVKMRVMLVEVAVKKVEPLPGRQAGRPLVAKAPLADLSGRIVGALEHLRHGHVFRSKVVLAVSPDVAMAGVQAGHQHATRRGAHG